MRKELSGDQFRRVREVETQRITALSNRDLYDEMLELVEEDGQDQPIGGLSGTRWIILDALKAEMERRLAKWLEEPSEFAKWMES